MLSDRFGVSWMVNVVPPERHTFGFEKQAAHANADGTIAHAQLLSGNGMIMPGSVLEKESSWGV